MLPIAAVLHGACVSATVYFIWKQAWNGSATRVRGCPVTLPRASVECDLTPAECAGERWTCRGWARLARGPWRREPPGQESVLSQEWAVAGV